MGGIKEHHHDKIENGMRKDAHAVLPENLEVMYAGKLCAMLTKMEVSASNILSGYERTYSETFWNKWDKEDKIKFLEELGESPNIAEKNFSDLDKSVKKAVIDLVLPETLQIQLKQQKETFLAKFDTARTDLSKIIKKHPLWEKVGGIRGFTAYQLGLIMSYIKDVSRFDSPSALMMYAGIGAITDNETGRSYPVTKANLTTIKEIYARQGKEFKGFNTNLSGRMFTIADCLLRAKGFFYYKYLDFRKRLEERAITKGECERMENGEYYMKGKKKQSLKIWSERNARRRIIRILLHLIWEEWRKLKNLDHRDPYVAEKLGHKEIITIDQVLKADATITANNKKKKAETKTETTTKP